MKFRITLGKKVGVVCLALIAGLVVLAYSELTYYSSSSALIDQTITAATGRVNILLQIVAQANTIATQANAAVAAPVPKNLHATTTMVAFAAENAAWTQALAAYQSSSVALESLPVPSDQDTSALTSAVDNFASQATTSGSDLMIQVANTAPSAHVAAIADAATIGAAKETLTNAAETSIRAELATIAATAPALVMLATGARNVELAIVVCLFLLAFWLLLWFYRTVARSFADMSTQIAAITAGNLGEQMPAKEDDERGMLARAINALSVQFKTMYEGLELERMKLAVIVDAMDDGVIIIDNQESAIFVNRMVRATFKIRDEHDAFKVLLEMFPVLNREQALLHVQGGTYYTAEIPLGDKFFEFKFQGIAGHGTAPEGIIIWIRDITDTKLLEQSKDDFLSIASHEMRTPLAIIRGNAELILDIVKTEKDEAKLRTTAEKMATSVHDSSVRLIQIVNDFLDVIHMERKVDLTIETLDLAKLTLGIVNDIKPSFEKKGLYLDVKRPSGMLPAVSVDANATKQVLLNIIGNALHYTEKGGITVTLEAEKDFVKMYVSDTGAGIDPSAQSSLFQKFQTAGKTFSRTKEYGSGLGLYIAKLLMESMKGTIVLQESAPGIGTTFAIRFRVATGEIAAPTSVAPTAAPRSSAEKLPASAPTAVAAASATKPQPAAEPVAKLASPNASLPMEPNPKSIQSSDAEKKE